jgi:hypothetical protein
MGYACPVCETPQADAEHLANHLAFTAMLRDDDHRVWLDDHVPGWPSLGPDDLAPQVADVATETSHETVFEDTTTDRGHPPETDGTAPDDPSRESDRRPQETAAVEERLDGDAADVLARARAMTREMLGEEADEGDGAESGVDGSADGDGKA